MRQRKLLAVLLACVLPVFLPGCAGGGENAAKKEGGYKIAVVPKTISINWFQHMGEGVAAYNNNSGTDYFFGGPTDPSDQAAYVEQLLAEDWDAICLVPFDIESIAPVLEKARREGVVVITHEGDTMNPGCYDYDLEPFHSQDLGRHFGEVLVQETQGKSGVYVQFLGSLNSVTHTLWTDSAKEYISAHSDMTLLGRYESNEDIVSAYNQTKELLQAHPEIIAIEGSASTDLPGIARAVEELGLTGKVAISGLSLSSISGEYVKNGTIASFSFWDTALAGQAMISLAEKVLAQGSAFDPESCSLPIEGYEKMEYQDGIFYGNAEADITAENLD